MCEIGFGSEIGFELALIGFVWVRFLLRKSVVNLSIAVTCGTFVPLQLGSFSIFLLFWKMGDFRFRKLALFGFVPFLVFVCKSL